MRRTMLNFEKFCRSNLTGLAMFAVALVLIGCFPPNTMAQEKGQKTFSSPEQAGQALFRAIQANDQKAMLDVLGKDAKQIVSSGDMYEDAKHHANFARRYLEMHRYVKEPDGTTTLYIGAQNWPAPIPLVEKSGRWYFDTDAAKDEILFRRVGHNELAAIRVSEELVAAQKEYHAAQNGAYAQQIVSDDGHQNGLYWPVTGNQPESPLGPLVARASVEYSGRVPKDPSMQPEPFHGYYFRVLTRQGKDAPGGAADYVVNGKMTAGFAFVAYPAEHRNSGVMTFIVGKDGVIYEKDLGEKTAELAKAINAYNPDSTWKKCEDQAQHSASQQKKN